MILGAIILFVIAFTWFYRTEKGRLAIDSILLRLPVLGILARKAAIAKFTRTMGTMLSSGVSILDALTSWRRRQETERLKMLSIAFEAPL